MNNFTFGSAESSSANAVELANLQADLDDKIAAFAAGGGAVTQLDNYGNQIGEYTPKVCDSSAKRKNKMIAPLVPVAVDIAPPPIPISFPVVTPTRPAKVTSVEVEQSLPGKVIVSGVVKKPECMADVIENLDSLHEARAERSLRLELRAIKREASKVSAMLDAIQARLK